jgi:hypothetical protein
VLAQPLQAEGPVMIDLRVDCSANAGLIVTWKRVYAHGRGGTLTLRQAGRVTAS